MEINHKDLVVTTFRTGSAWFPKDNGVTVTHIPTGIKVSCDTERSQHANKAKALDNLTEIFTETTKALLNLPSMNKPTIELTYKQLRERIVQAINDALDSRCVALWQDWPGSMHIAGHVTSDLAKVVDFGKEKIQRGSKVVVVGGFSKGSVGIVEFVEPLANGKIWVTRNGDSGPKFWLEHELEILAEKL